MKVIKDEELAALEFEWERLWKDREEVDVWLNFEMGRLV